jgi:very-short-patch-repair endonuclease
MNSTVNNNKDEDDFTLFRALSRAKFRGGMVMQRPIVLRVTLPDFCWPLKKKAVYLDGVQVHRKAHVERRDEEINTLMTQRGWQILRIPYEPPLTPHEVVHIVDQIREFIGE